MVIGIVFCSVVPSQHTHTHPHAHTHVNCAHICKYTTQVRNYLQFDHTNAYDIELVYFIYKRTINMYRYSIDANVLGPSSGAFVIFVCTSAFHVYDRVDLPILISGRGKIERENKKKENSMQVTDVQT